MRMVVRGDAFGCSRTGIQDHWGFVWLSAAISRTPHIGAEGRAWHSIDHKSALEIGATLPSAFPDHSRRTFA